MSAQRSRLKKRQQLEEMQEEKSLLSAENKALRAEVSRLKQILTEHLDCSVTVRAGTRETLSRQVSGGAEDQTQTKSVHKQNIETQTPAHCEPYKHQTQSPFRYESATSPPQIYPEDLRVRVDTRVESRVESGVESVVSLHLKQDEKSVPPESCAVTPPGPGTEGRRSKMKQRLALHCEKVGQKKKLKATNKARLKDKLQIIKQKLAEDENVWSSLQSTKNK